MRITIGTVDIPECAERKISEHLKSGRISQGARVAEFEKAFAEYHGMKECVAVSTGTSADTIALASLQNDWGNIRKKYIMLPALTFISCANSVMHSGFLPEFVDVDSETFQIDADAAIDLCDERTAAIMPVHLFGKPAPVDRIMEWTNSRPITVIEDCAEAHGAITKNRIVGTMGDMATFSFYVAHIITCGEGGAILTNNPESAEIFRSLRSHGRSCVCRQCVMNVKSDRCTKRFRTGIDSRFHFSRIGYSEKMNELEAVLALECTKNLDAVLAARRRNRKFLMTALFGYSDELAFLHESPGDQISPLCFPIVVKENAKFTRENIVTYLESNGIETRPMFSSIPTQESAYSFLGYKLGQFPNAERIGRQGFYIGCHQNIREDDLCYIDSIFKKFFDKGFS